MEPPRPAALQAIDAATLTPIVRQATGRADALAGEWQVSQLGGGAGNPVSLGLYRAAGEGWSVILKIVQSPANVGQVDMGEGDDQSHWNYWKRELYAYPSELLAALPAGLVAPRCFGVSEQPGNTAWLWLEDIRDDEPGAWTLERYALTARHLGRLNGLYAGRPVPALPWLARRRARTWVNLIPWRDLPWDHPQVRARYPRPEANAFRRLLLESERFLAQLDRLPQTICHGDTYPTNFKARVAAGTEPQTVALDWALMGIAPVGDDLGQLVFGAHTNLSTTPREDVDAALFVGYLAGLRDSGCTLDRRTVRLGYTASAALRVGLFQVFLLGQTLRPDEPKAAPADDPPPCFEVAMAEEAYALLD